MATTQEKEPSALSIAYETVSALGYSHSKLKEFTGVNYPTLRNIRDGKNLKPSTEHFYLKLFVGLIIKEYNRRLADGGDGTQYLLTKLKDSFWAYIN